MSQINETKLVIVFKKINIYCIYVQYTTALELQKLLYSCRVIVIYDNDTYSLKHLFLSYVSQNMFSLLTSLWINLLVFGKTIRQVAFFATLALFRTLNNKFGIPFNLKRVKKLYKPYEAILTVVKLCSDSTQTLAVKQKMTHF